MIENDDGTFALITYGTLSAAVYHLVATGHRDHPMVKFALSKGIEDAVVYTKRMPVDVVTWLRDYHNTFHGGSGYSFAELYNVTSSVDRLIHI